MFDKEVWALAGRVLTLRFRSEDYQLLDRRHLLFGLFWTWLAGMGRYWDNPRVDWPQKLGLGSLIYVFVLALLLWLFLLPATRKASYRRLLTYVTLTAPPAVLYAIPVEQFLEADLARSVNFWFLAVVALWRVLMYFVFLRRVASLYWLDQVVVFLLPLALVILTLTQLNLEKAVFNLMAGNDGSPAATAMGFLFLLSIFSILLSPVLLLTYLLRLGCVWRKDWRRPSPE